MEISLNHLRQSDLAAIFSNTERTIQRWSQYGLPKHGEDQGCYYVWAEVLPWYVTYAAGLASGDPEGKLPRIQPHPGPNHFRAMDLLEQAQEALRGEAGTAFKRIRKKATPKRAQSKPNPRHRRAQTGVI